MIEDDLTVIEMRHSPRAKPKRKVFMLPGDLRKLRTTVLRVTQSKLAEQLISPDTGSPVVWAAISFWERGERPIPLWVARRVRDLAEAAKRYDLKGILNG